MRWFYFAVKKLKLLYEIVLILTISNHFFFLLLLLCNDNLIHNYLHLKKTTPVLVLNIYIYESEAVFIFNLHVIDILQYIQKFKYMITFKSLL